MLLRPPLLYVLIAVEKDIHALPTGIVPETLLIWKTIPLMLLRLPLLYVLIVGEKAIYVPHIETVQETLQIWIPLLQMLALGEVPLKLK